MNDSLQGLARQLDRFARDRDWKQFHSPKNLASALIVEAGELLEHFQWMTEAQSRELAPEQLETVGAEIADVLLYLIQLADALGIDPVAAARAKLQVNEVEVPGRQRTRQQQEVRQTLSAQESALDLMTASSSAEGEPAWTRAIELERLRASGRATVKLGSKQLALFLHDGTVHACNNRCPHEGYPLVEGALDAESCVLTCHWHNWKFDLRTGANHYGGDSLRIYPVKVDDAGVVWVDARDAPAEERVQQALAQLDDAMADHDAPRIARELARLDRAGAGPEVAVARAIERSHERLRYGMTHAWAGAEVWLRLRDTLDDPTERLACAAEALSHIAYDTLREPAFPFAPAQPLARWDDAGVPRRGRGAGRSRRGLAAPRRPGRRAAASPTSSRRSPPPRWPTTTTSAMR